ncbi:MAG: GAF domain-containing protein, partial [Acidobacteriota bacterium]
WIGIPLFDGETTLGLITLSCDRPDAYSNGITDTLSLFGSHATVALQKADLFESARRRIRDLEILNTIVHDMNSLVEVTAQDLFETVVRQVAENLGCSHATIFLKRRAGGEDRLVPQATFGDEGDRIKDRSFGLDEGLAGWAFTTGQADVLDDARKDPRFADARQHQEKPRSMVVAPVMSGSSVIGVLTADQDEFAWFDEHNKRLLTAIGHHVGLIAERQDLLDELRRRRKAQIAAVTDITDAVAKAQDLQTILETILAWCMVLLRGTQLGTIRLLEPGSRRLKLEAVKIAEGTISRDDFPDMRVGEGIMGWVAKQKRPALVPDVRTDERYIRRIEGILSALAVPIRDDDEIVGVLNLEHPRRAFRKEDRNSAEAIAGLASVAYRSAILRRRIEAQQDAEIEAIKEIATAITIGEPQRHLALHSIVEKLVDLMGKEDLAVVVRLLSDDRQVLRAEAWTKDRTLPGFEIELPIDRGVTGWVAREGKTALVPNTRENVRYVSGLSEAQSELAVPMVASGQVIGVLNIESPRLGAFDERDIKFAEAIASLAVVAIDNARLYETLALRSEKLEDLYEVSTEVSSLLKLREAAKLIAESANRLLESDAATLYTFPANSSDLGPGIHVEQDGDMEVGIEPPADDEWLEGLFTLGQVGGWSSQLDQNTDPRTEGSTWVIPLLYSGERLGVLYLHYSELNDPKEEYPGIAQLFGVQAAIAIKNAREFAEARNRVKMEKWAELGKLAGSFAHRLGNKGGMIRVKTRELSGLFSDLPDMGKRIQAQEAAELIQLSTTYLLELSNLLLKPSRASRASRTPTDLKLLLNSAIRHASISKDVTIRVSLPDALPKIPANRVFRELFLEIILNAVEAMKARPKKTLEITADIDADFVFLHFEDTGIGLGPGDKQHIFKLFASGAGKSEDTGHRGFGLWWVRTFLKDIGGEISVTSSPGQGSTFTLRLPRT